MSGVLEPVKPATASRLGKAGIAIPLAAGLPGAPVDAALRRRVTVGFIVAVLLTIFIGVSSWRGARRAEQDDYWVAHTHEVMQTIQRTSRHVIEAGTSARAFALSGEEPLLTNYQKARVSVSEDENTLRQLTADNLSEQRRMDTLGTQVDTALEFAAGIIAERQRTQAYPGGGDALEVESLLDVVRATTQEMYAEESRLLVQRTERAHVGQRFTRVIAISGAFLGVGLWVVARLAVNREIAVSSRARMQLSTLNAGLERRVEQRTAALQSQIIEREQAEQKLRESQERLRLLLDGIKDYAIYMLDPTGHVISWNAGAARIKGYPSEEILGKDFSRFYKAEDIAAGKPLRELQQAFSTGRHEEEALRVRKDGSVFWANVVITPMYDDSGALRGFSKVTRDITERKEVAERLAQQAEELAGQAGELALSRQVLETQSLTLRSVLDSMSEGLVAADEQGKVIIWNAAATKILGLDATNLPSQEWSAHYGLYLEDMVTPFPADQLPLVRAIRGETNTAQMFVRNAELDEGAWIEVSGGPLKDKDGAVRGGVVAFRDITRSRADALEIGKLNDELELRVARRTAQLETANQELEAFSYSVSHDLRAPLRHIVGFSKILLEEFGSGLDARAQHYVERIQAGTQKMGLLVDELLNLARVGRHTLRLHPTRLNPIVAEVIAILRPDSEGRQVKWVIADLPAVECDPVLIQQIFQNLLANALKFTRPRAEAIIEVGYREEEEDGQPVFMVRDNGIGFNMKYVDKLFGVFQRLHSADEFEGTGIGLVTVQRIVHKHGGRVWAEGTDKGAVFYFTLGGGSKRNRKTMQQRLEASHEFRETRHPVGGRQSGRHGSCPACAAAGEAGKQHLRRTRWRGSSGLSVLSRGLRGPIV